MKRSYIAGILGLVLVVILAVAMTRLSHSFSEKEQPGFSDVVIRGGGFITGLEVQGETMYARTDVGGAYRFDTETQQWEQMIDATTVTTDRRSTDYQVESLGASPSDPATVYALVGASSDASPGARLLRSTNGGRNWTILPNQWYVAGNAKWRQSGARIAVDPSNPRVLFVGTRRDGLQISRDAGVSWQSVIEPALFDEGSGLADIGVTSVVIDPLSPLVDGSHAVVWAGIGGVGLMVSRDGGKSWAVASPFETGFVSDMALSPNGAVVAAFYGVGPNEASYVKRVEPTGEVVDISPPDQGRWLTLAADPKNPGTLVVASDNVRRGVGMLVTRNSEAAQPDWVAIPSTIAADGDDGTTWPTKSSVYDFLSTGQIRFFDDEIWFAEGVGMWRTDSTFADSLNWRFASDGIEEFVGNAILKPVDAPLLTAQWDRGLMRHPDPTKRDPSQGQEASFPYTTWFGSAWDISESATDPDFLVAVLDDHQDLTGQTAPERRASGYSTDGGASWTRFPALANGTAPGDLLFGNIAVSAQDNSNLVWIPSNLTGLETKIYYSRDAGGTWVSGQINGLTSTQFLHNKYVQARKILVAAPSVQGEFYAMGSDDTGAAIVWKSLDGGANWDIVWNSGPADPGTSGFKYDSTLVAAGEYLIASPGTGGGCSYRSRDGVRWERLCALKGAQGMGIGASTEKSGPPNLYSYGTVDGAIGIYRSTDFGSRWQRLVNYPGGMYMGVRAVAGDPQVSGRVYVALNGGGFLMGQF